MKQVYELHGQGVSVRGIAERLDIARNTVRKYLRSPEVPKAKPRQKRGSKLDPFVGYLQQRLADGVDNCVVLLRELTAQGYTGGYTVLKDYVQPLRLARQPKATVRFETEPGEQAQVDFGLFRYETPDGKTCQVWAFVMVLSWSRAIYVEFIRRADTPSFIRCHLNAFARLGGISKRCLYDNTKLVVLERNAAGEAVFNPQFLDFALRLGFGVQLCHPYRAQTKGRVESGVKYVRRNFWPSARFADLEDLNRQVQAWVETVANTRVHGTTHERPASRLEQERGVLGRLPGQERLTVWLREERKVGRDGFVQWERAAYGVPWSFVGQLVQVQPGESSVEVWRGETRIAVHPRATRPGQRFVLPGQWAGLEAADGRPRKEALAVQLPTVEVEKRPLAVYESVVAEVAGQ